MMQTQVDPAILSRLDALAAKLGVTAAHLWAVLIRQAYVNGIEGVLFLIPAVLLLRWAFRRAEADEFDNPAWVILTMVAGIGTLLAVIFTIDSVATMFNPEYFALHEVMSALR